ncbi:DUF3592 domain-containing protein [Kitasatospora sp. NPDC050463]|uniref:DUF3592 domain-containing protein n=1 Tax=Kitasatospora sp. NPDC050463 TaxID=3155786 RepID=UPI0033C83AA3
MVGGLFGEKVETRLVGGTLAGNVLGRVRVTVGAVALVVTGVCLAVGVWPTADGRSPLPRGGWILCGICFAVSALGHPRLRSRDGWLYGTAYLALLAVVLCVGGVHAGLRRSGIQDRTTEPVTATLSECDTISGGDGPDTSPFRCRYTWTLNGRQYQEDRTTIEPHRDGDRLPLWVDPETGRTDDHDAKRPVMMFVLAAVAGLLVLGYLVLLVRAWTAALRRSRRRAAPGRRPGLTRPPRGSP